MAKFKSMSKGFTPIPEGVHIFKITKVEYTEDETSKDYGKVVITMQIKDGKTHVEKMGIMKENKLEKTWEINTKVYNRFEYFSKVALNNFSLDEWDPEDLEGCYISCSVTHTLTEGTGNNEGKTYTNVNLSDFNTAVGFGSDSGVDSEPESESADLDDDLDDLE